MKNIALCLIIIGMLACKEKEKEAEATPIVMFEETEADPVSANYYCVTDGEGIIVRNRNLEMAWANYEAWKNRGKNATIQKCND